MWNTGGVLGAWEAMERLLAEQGLFRPRDLKREGLSPGWLALLEGVVVRKLAPGLYGPRGTVLPTLLLASARVPRGIFCLESALVVHGYLEATSENWMAIGARDHATTIAEPPIRFLRVRPRLLALDVEERSLLGWNLRVYGLKRTFIDCIRHRKRLGRYGRSSQSLNRPISGPGRDSTQRRAPNSH